MNSNSLTRVATEWQWEYHWPWPPWATLLLVIGAALWIGFCYVRDAGAATAPYRTLLAGLRMGAVAVLLFMLTGLVARRQQTGPPALALVVDHSASMGMIDMLDDGTTPAQATRLDRVRALLANENRPWFDHLADRYELVTHFVANDVRRGAEDALQVAAELQALDTGAPDARATRLGEAVRAALRNGGAAPPVAVVVLTDGITNVGIPLASAAELARSKGVPLYLVGVGNDDPPRDLELTDLLVDDIVFVDDIIRFQATLKSSGLAGESVRVVLNREGSSEVLAAQQLQIPEGDQVLPVQLTYRSERAGDTTFVVSVEPRRDEVDRDNNTVRHTVSIRDEKIRVLFAQGYPNYEFRYLKTLLSRDSSIDLDTYLQEADSDYVRAEETAIGAFPVSREALAEYDVLILGDVDPRLLPRSVWANVFAFVDESGGGLALIAGPRYLPWQYRENRHVAALLPVDVESIARASSLVDQQRGFAPQPTELGLQSAALQLGSTLESTRQIWRSLSPLFWLAEVGQVKPAAHVLAEHPTRTGSGGRNLPVICQQYLGNGHVLFHAVDSTWRWRFRIGDVYFARYWVQTIRQLARSKLASRGGAELTTDRREYQEGEPVEIRLRLLGPQLAASRSATLLAQGPNQMRQRVPMEPNPAARGVMEATLTNLASGGYRLLLIDPTVPGNPPTREFRVTSPDGELTRVAMNRAELVAAAQMTHGKFYTLDGAARLLDELPAGRRVPIASLPTVPIWNHPAVLATLLSLLVAEWVLRRRKGML